MYKYHQKFRVTSDGRFPLDMLRYDHCWPAFEIEMCEIDLGGNMLGEMRTITMARHVTSPKDMPTVERWASFGWKVDQASIQTNKL